MKHRGPVLPSNPPGFTVSRYSLLAFFIVGLLVISACSSPFTDDDDSGTETGVTPVPTEGVIPGLTPTQTDPDEPTVVVEDEWTIITGPERRDPPDSRDENQTLRLSGTSDGPPTIDPALVRDTQSAFFVRQVFRGLVRFNNDLEPVPDLAERIEVSADGLTYRFILHDGITFHDGSAIQAEDIKASLERAADPALVNGDGSELPVRNYLDDIDGALERMAGKRDDIPGIQAPDQRTLEISLVRGAVDFLERLANPTTYIVDVDNAAEGGEWWRSPNGSGPFTVLEWDTERILRLGPHDGYVRPPALNEVSVRLGRDAVGEVRLYETREIDVASVPTSAIDRFDYEGSPHDGELREDPMLSTTYVMINPNIEPFNDERMRQALLHGFPRDRIPTVMLDGRVNVANSVLPPEMEGAGAVEFPYEFNEDVARSLLMSVRGTTLQDSVTIYSSGGAIPVAMKTYYDQVLMLDAEVVQLRWSDYLDDLQDRQLPLFVLSWVADGPDPVSFLRSLFHSESPENYIDFADAEVDGLLDQAMIERDSERRQELARDAHQRILDSAVVMPLYHSVDYMLVADHVRGLETTPMGILGLEMVWIEQ
jgi:oligopeptide transport system substrate-binding protein